MWGAAAARDDSLQQRHQVLDSGWQIWVVDRCGVFGSIFCCVGPRSVCTGLRCAWTERHRQESQENWQTESDIRDRYGGLGNCDFGGGVAGWLLAWAQLMDAITLSGTRNNMVFCRGCGREIHESALSCPQCGAIQKSVGARGEKSRVAAALLAFFLGGLGAHKFYLGRIGAGILYLLFCWTFIPSFIAFIEFIIYLTMSDAAFAEKYG
jgi:hypothetical protein